MENADYLLCGDDPFSRTPYERGVFAREWRARTEPTADEIAIFKASTLGLRQCTEEFFRGVQLVDARPPSINIFQDDEVWMEWLPCLRNL